jgi:hypothetical protein
MRRCKCLWQRYFIRLRPSLRWVHLFIPTGPRTASRQAARRVYCGRLYIKTELPVKPKALIWEYGTVTRATTREHVGFFGFDNGGGIAIARPGPSDLGRDNYGSEFCVQALTALADQRRLAMERLLPHWQRTAWRFGARRRSE